MLVFFTNLILWDFRSDKAYFFFSVIDGFEWFWMGSLHKNIHLMLKFLNFWFYTFPTIH